MLMTQKYFCDEGL